MATKELLLECQKRMNLTLVLGHTNTVSLWDLAVLERIEILLDVDRWGLLDDPCAEEGIVGSLKYRVSGTTDKTKDKREAYCIFGFRGRRRRSHARIR